MKKYETYKDSGLEWLGMVPEHWGIVPLKYLLSEPLQYGANESADNCNPSEPRYIRITDITEDGKLRKSTYRTLPYQKAEGYMLKKGDILFARSGATVGKTFIFEEDYDACFAGYLIKASCNEKLLPMFLYYFTSSNSYENWKNSTFNQATIQNIGADKYCTLPIPTPSSEEQEGIINFLSHIVAQIDALISEKEKMVEDLKAYRSSLITETVTKGLDKGVEMKDSGVEWIEKIPATWTTVLLKRCATIMTGGTPSTDIDRYWANPTFHWYTPSDFSDDDVVLNDSSRKLDKTAIKEHAAKLFPQNSVLVVGIGATLGKVGISLNECSSNQQVNAIIFNPTVLPEYGAYYLLAGKEYIRSQSNAATLPILNQSTMGELQIVVPTIDEQKDIVGFINKKVSVIKESIENLQIQISDLKSYKSSLITEAVTGKIDFRDWQTKKS